MKKGLILLASALAALTVAYAAWADDGSVNTGSNIATNVVNVSSGPGKSTHQDTQQQIVSVSGSNGADGASGSASQGKNGADGTSVSTSVSVTGGVGTTVSCSITTKTVGNVTTTTQTGDCAGATVTTGTPPADQEMKPSGSLWLWFRWLCK